jgi:IS5 family transposase
LAERLCRKIDVVRPLFLARHVLEQERRQRGRKVYSLHAPEVECIGKGKAHRPYEFGVKVSVATTVKHSAGGQFVTHVAALPGNPYDASPSSATSRNITAWGRNHLAHASGDAINPVLSPWATTSAACSRG